MDNQIYKNLEKLDDIQKSLEKDIDKNIKEEEEVIQIIEDIISKLIVFDTAKVTINKKNYTLKFLIKETGKTKNIDGKKVVERNLCLIAADDAKVKLLQKKYIPCYATVDYNYELSIKGNLTAAVEAWVRHITGTIKVDTIE